MTQIKNIDQPKGTSKLDKRLAARQRSVKRPDETVDEYIARRLKAQGKPRKRKQL